MLMEQALSLLAKRTGKLQVVSSYYETAPWGFESSEPFLNQVAVFETGLSSRDFLEICLQTEKKLGRIRNAPESGYSSRTMDIDILFCNSDIIESPALTIPHPRITERNFVLVPLVEIMPDFIHPVFRKTIRELAETCPDTLSVTKLPPSS